MAVFLCVAAAASSPQASLLSMNFRRRGRLRSTVFPACACLRKSAAMVLNFLERLFLEV